MALYIVPPMTSCITSTPCKPQSLMQVENAYPARVAFARSDQLLSWILLISISKDDL
jgi:hypothetical protein